VRDHRRAARTGQRVLRIRQIMQVAGGEVPVLGLAQ
jgi:hypothetical protein